MLKLKAAISLSIPMFLSGCVNLQPGDLDKILDRFDQHFPVAPSASPSPSSSASTRPTPSIFPSSTPTPGSTPSPSISPTTAPTPTGTPSPGTLPTATPTPVVQPSASPSPEPTPTPVESVQPSSTPTPSSPEPTPTITSLPTATPVPTPTPTITPIPQGFGNSFVAFLNVANPMAPLDSIAGIDIHNQSVYVSHFVDGFTSNSRNIREINFLTGPRPDITVFSTQTGQTPVISGLAVNSNNEIWITLGKPDGNGYNLYRHNASGSQIDRHKVNATDANTILNDVAVSGNLVYMACPTTASIFKFDVSNSANTQILFSGATAINPAGVAVDSGGNVYTTDLISRKVIKFSPNGTRLLEFDGKGVNGSGTAFTAMADVAIDPRNGDIYVAGDASGKKIQRYTSAGNFVHSFTSSNLVSPDKMAVRDTGEIFVTDNNKKGILIFAAGL